MPESLGKPEQYLIQAHVFLTMPWFPSIPLYSLSYDLPIKFRVTCTVISIVQEDRVLFVCLLGFK